MSSGVGRACSRRAFTRRSRLKVRFSLCVRIQRTVKLGADVRTQSAKRLKHMPCLAQTPRATLQCPSHAVHNGWRSSKLCQNGVLVHTWAAKGPAHKFVSKTFAPSLVSEQPAQMSNMRAIAVICFGDGRCFGLAWRRRLHR